MANTQTGTVAEVQISKTILTEYNFEEALQALKASWLVSPFYEKINAWEVRSICDCSECDCRMPLSYEGTCTSCRNGRHKN